MDGGSCSEVVAVPRLKDPEGVTAGPIRFSSKSKNTFTAYNERVGFPEWGRHRGRRAPWCCYIGIQEWFSSYLNLPPSVGGCAPCSSCVSGLWAVRGERCGVGRRAGAERGSGERTPGPTEAASRNSLVYERAGARGPGV